MTFSITPKAPLASISRSKIVPNQEDSQKLLRLTLETLSRKGFRPLDLERILNKPVYPRLALLALLRCTDTLTQRGISLTKQAKLALSDDGPELLYHYSARKIGQIA